MRSFVATLGSILVSTVVLSACASSTPAPTAEKAAEVAKPAPRCYSGDDGKFHPLGQGATISGVDVVCAATADGKSAQWMSAKAHK